MKELLRKGFWQGLKKTFDEALEDPPLGENSSQVPAEGQPDTSSGADDSTAPERSADLDTPSTAQ